MLMKRTWGVNRAVQWKGDAPNLAVVLDLFQTCGPYVQAILMGIVSQKQLRDALQHLRLHAGTAVAVKTCVATGVAEVAARHQRIPLFIAAFARLHPQPSPDHPLSTSLQRGGGQENATAGFVCRSGGGLSKGSDEDY